MKLRMKNVFTGRSFAVCMWKIFLSITIWLVLMAAAGHRTVGMDMSPLMLKEAKKNSENYGVHVDFILGDAQMPPFEEASFDVIVSRNVTWNLPDVHGAYTGWYGLLRRGGVLLNFDSNYGPVDFAANAAEPDNVHNELDRDGRFSFYKWINGWNRQR